MTTLKSESTSPSQPILVSEHIKHEMHNIQMEYVHSIQFKQHFVDSNLTPNAYTIHCPRYSLAQIHQIISRFDIQILL